MGTGRETAGPSTTLRSGRDDKGRALAGIELPPPLFVIPTGAKRSGGTCGFSPGAHLVVPSGLASTFQLRYVVDRVDLEDVREDVQAAVDLGGVQA